MFDPQKQRQLQQRSHNRGLLSKQFYHGQQQQLQRKRREMKQHLDAQVQQKRLKKQHERLQKQTKMRQEQDRIKQYYKSLEGRDRKNISIVKDNIQLQIKNNSYQPVVTRTINPQQSMPNHLHQPKQQLSSLLAAQHQTYRIYGQLYPQPQQYIQQNSRGTIKGQPHPTFLSDNINIIDHKQPIDSRLRQNFPKVRANSKAYIIQDGNMPVMSLLDSQSSISSPQQQSKIALNSFPTSKQGHSMAIPWMQSSTEQAYYQLQPQQPSKIKIYKAKGHKQPTKNNHNHKDSYTNHDQHRTTQADEESIISNVVQPIITNNPTNDSILHININPTSNLNPPIYPTTRNPQSDSHLLHPPPHPHPHPQSQPRHSHSIQDYPQHYNSTHNRQNTYVDQQIHQFVQENKNLKHQLLKSQQAINLLLDAVRPNAKFDRIRVQAEKILNRGDSFKRTNKSQLKPNKTKSRQQKPRDRSNQQKIKDEDMFLPKLNVKTQSLMHDYILGTAKKYSRMKLLQDGHGKY